MKSAVVYGLVTPDGTGYQEVPLGTSPQARSLQLKVLPKKAVSLPPRRSALDGNSLLQQRIRDWNSPLSFGYSYRNLGGTAAPFTAYTPEPYYEPGHGGILPPLEPLSPGHHQLDYTWTVPSVPGATGLFANVVYIGEKQRQLISQGIPQAVHDISSDGSNTGTTVATVDGTELYNGPARVLWPWVTGYASGQYNLRMTVDGDVRVDEDYIQQALIFEQPFPQSTVDNPGDTTITNRFGWSIDDINIDDSLQLDNPSWSAGLTTGALHDAPRHLGNQVSFTINALKETLTKHIQPLTNVPLNLGPVAKETQPNKTLPYYVYAHADAVTDYRLDSAGSLPGYRAMVQVSNFRQTPSPAILGQPTTFSFDVTPINFDTAEMDFSLGLGASADGGQYSWSTTEGNPTKTSNGWHVEVPWTTTTLPSLAGMLEVNCHDTVLPQRYASQQVPFTVGLEQAQKKLRIDNLTPIPETFSPLTGERTHLNYKVFYEGTPPPGATVNTQVQVFSGNQTQEPFATFSDHQEVSAEMQFSTPDWDGRNSNGDQIISGPFSWVVNANTTVQVAGGIGDTEIAPSQTVQAVAQTITTQNTGMKVTCANVLLAETKNGVMNTTLLGKVQKHSSEATGGNTSDLWDISLSDPSLSNIKQPNPIPFVARGCGSSSISGNLTYDFTQGLYVGRLSVDDTLLKDLSGTPVETHSLIQGKIVNSKTVNGTEQKFVDEQGTKLRDTIFPPILLDPSPSGSFFEILHWPGSTVQENQEREGRLLTQVPLDRSNFVGHYGYVVIGISAQPASGQPFTTSVKVARAPHTVLVSGHGDHDGTIQLTPEVSQDRTVQPPVLFQTWDPLDLRRGDGSERIRKVIAGSCSPFDLHDYNNFFTNAHFPGNGHLPNVDIASNKRTFGGYDWDLAFASINGRR